jgi:glycosyltransferase involved in cell wall biosynthesis
MNTPKHYFPVSEIPDEYKTLIHIEAIDVNSSVKPLTLFTNFLFSSKPYHTVRFDSISFRNKLMELLKSETFDVVLFEGLYVLPYIKTIRLYSKAFLVFRAHNIEHEIWERVAKNEHNFFKKFYLKNLAHRIFKTEKKLIHQVDLLFALTARDEAQFRRIGYKKISQVSQAGIDLHSTKMNRFSIQYPSLFFIGALDWLPNQEGLLWFIRNIWPNILLKFPELKFEIAGRNAPHWLVNKIEECQQVIYHGEVSDSHEFMSKRAVMVVPLFSGSGMRVKIIEGMALGKSIITTSIGSEGIPTTHNQNILIADSADMFQNEVIRLLTDKELFETVGVNAYQFINENYNIETIVKNSIQFIQKAISI